MFMSDSLVEFQLKIYIDLQLKKSHIGAPLGGTRQFSTEHLDQYTAKRTARFPIDSGRLQRSTVPLGTLNIK